MVHFACKNHVIVLTHPYEMAHAPASYLCAIMVQVSPPLLSTVITKMSKHIISIHIIPDIPFYFTFSLAECPKSTIFAHNYCLPALI